MKLLYEEKNLKLMGENGGKLTNKKKIDIQTY